MRMIITLYGCSEYFHKIAAQGVRDYRTVTISIRTRFVGAVCVNHLGNPSPIPDNDFIISEEVVPIPYLCFADVVILLNGNETLPPWNETQKGLDFICRNTTAEIGELWNEFVRAFIDSGAFVGVRLTYCTRQFRWSCEGHRQ